MGPVEVRPFDGEADAVDLAALYRAESAAAWPR